jgi:hypothetical protein
MLATPCRCARPRIFAPDAETCHRCGRSTPLRITASTMRLAVAIVEVLRGGGYPAARREPTP